MLKKFQFVVIVLFLTGYKVLGQNLESELSKIYPYIQALQAFSAKTPQEKVSLHFDNTSYYQGDHIWFKCYIVSSGLNRLSDLSKTLYVELLTPGGAVIDQRILKVENGQCHGDFTLNQIPFYSGFYEVRAYTKYMLNFGEDAIFSRLLPVFDKPKVEGNFKEKEITPYSRWNPYPMKRTLPVRGNKVNIRFFPEGGNLIQGLRSRVAFEAADEAGNPIDIVGVVRQWNTDNEGYKEIPIATLHEGKGVFTYTPQGNNRQKDIVEVEYGGRKYSFDLPAAMTQGVLMEVDNLSSPDSISITFRKNRYIPSAETLGVAVLTGGKLQNHFYVMIEDDKEVSYQLDKMLLPAGVSQIVLFNSRGEIFCDRLIFAGKVETLDMAVKTDKPVYLPYESVNIEITVSNSGLPINETFSLSVRDGANMVESNHTILTDLLLMSEIKGYVRNPSWYFEADDDQHRAALDVLLMVQGWRRYSWNRMAGVETDNYPSLQIKYFPEQGIGIDGRVVSLGARQMPQPNVDVSLLLFQKGKEEEFADFAESFVTDTQGHFSFVADVEGRWNMIFGVTEKGKPRNRLVLLNRFFSPAPKRYGFAEMQVSLVEAKNETVQKEETFIQTEEEYESFLRAYQDSLARTGITEKEQTG